MDELKLLIEMVANLPTLAIWVLVGYLVYKVAVIGSIYGLLRLLIEKTHNWLTVRKTESIGIVLDGVPFDKVEGKTELLQQLRRLAYIGTFGGYKSSGIYGEYGIKHLKEAIDKIESEAKATRGDVK